MEHTLKKLGKRVWALDELPDGVDVNILRRLDVNEWIEVRLVYMQNIQASPDGPALRQPKRMGWFSPVAMPKMAGRWSQIIEKTTRDAQNHPPEIRLTERGLVELERPLAVMTTNGDQEPTDLIPLSTAADLFDVVTKTTRDWRKKGWLPVYGPDKLPSEAECRALRDGWLLPKRRRPRKSDAV